MPYQSPISPGVSWYEATIADRPRYPRLDGSRRADVVIVGGGFTGLSAAVHLAEAGADVVLLEAHRVGDGASGRNGGQLGTGQRAWAEELEAQYGLTRARMLFDLAEEAKAHLLEFAQSRSIDIEYVPGQMSVVHKPRYLKHYRAHAEIMAEQFGYRHIHYMDADETARRLGSTRYLGGLYDANTGHIQPMKLVIGTARAAAAAGAAIHEETPVTNMASGPAGVTVETGYGTVTADKCLLAVNAHGGKLEPVSAAHVMPIRSFIGATVPLGDDSPVLPGGESVDDSRFVVRYFRRAKDGRLLFGGREAYTADNPRDISTHIRRQIAEIYPQLADVEMTEAWGGSVGITMPRQPFVREVMPNVISAGGYSGHGVMLSNFVGKLYAETVAGNRDRLKLFEELKVPAFPGGRTFRAPLLFLALSWYALMDRI
ncbi:FAD-binding oxidoreductase [Phyllobacterium sp. 0TCS1.6C]|uniref:NAD(P)/FAD-dependent oxidoreductase n=1 Tax=unclassified Phyllobacterium TaxID=2638441 RepID=UPI002264FE41|nr:MULTISPECIES: FAD-binding oxidoreductase [unclassified Phyllobacterium]MCX8281241.1 FAD-binding oxidoreductase [Phyllobacterium sp. 0TCS1.6C]MCX8294473.1 FAD-binding oxidoreductase [Phyllobacterium sp. 0TCS1.6A]